MRILLIVMVCLVGGLSLVNAQEYSAPPIEVHIQRGDVLYMHDCYPLPWPNTVGVDTLIVYINYPSGPEGWGCWVTAGTKILPILPSGFKMAYGEID